MGWSRSRLALTLTGCLFSSRLAACHFLGLSKLSKLAVPIAYPAFMSVAIIVGNFHGFRTGEWKGASRQSVSWIAAGIAALVLGVCILGYADSIPKKEPAEKPPAVESSQP